MLRPYIFLDERVLALTNHGVYRPRRTGAGGGGGAIGNGESLFQMSSTISHFPLCCIQCTMYLPESTAGVPGGSFAPAGKVQCQLPRSIAMSPAPCTASA